jgi:hypothetical protein
MKKFEAAEMPPLVDGLETVMLAVPTLEISPAVTVVVNWELETKVVGRVLPLNWTVAAESKFVPLTFIVNPTPPAIAELGIKEAIVGALGAGVGGCAGVGGGVRLKGGAGLTKFPPTRTTWPPLVLKARPFCPQRIKRKGLPATLLRLIEVIGVK